MVVSKPVAQDVRAKGLAAVVLDLIVLLIGLLRRQQVRAGAEGIKGIAKAERVAANGQLDAGHGIKNVAACDCVGYAVAELGIAVADLVRERAGREVQSDYVRGRIVDVGKWLEGIGHER